MSYVAIWYLSFAPSAVDSQAYSEKYENISDVGDGLRRVNRLRLEVQYHFVVAWFHTQGAQDIIDTS